MIPTCNKEEHRRAALGELLSQGAVVKYDKRDVMAYEGPSPKRNDFENLSTSYKKSCDICEHKVPVYDMMINDAHKLFRGKMQPAQERMLGDGEHDARVNIVAPKKRNTIASAEDTTRKLTPSKKP